MYKAKIAPSAYIAKGAVVLGNVTVGKECSIWYNATVRSTSNHIIIGDGSNVQDNVVIHTDEEYLTSIGSHVTIGHGAIIHGCTIDDNSLIGMGAIVMNGAKVGKNCIIAAGTLIPQNKVIPDNSLVMGSPGKIVREVTAEEIEGNRQSAQHYIDERLLCAKLDNE